MTATADSIFVKAGKVLNDATQTRWTESTLIGWINDGLLAVGAAKPEVSNKTASFVLAAGTKQSLPAEALSLVGPGRNMGTGSTPGSQILLFDFAEFVKLFPNWSTITASGVVQCLVYNPDVPKEFFAFPPQPATPTYIEIPYAVTPTLIAAKEDNISIDDRYVPVLLDYILHRAFSHDTEEGSPVKADAHHKAFLSAL